jgi:hypothetical protein
MKDSVSHLCRPPDEGAILQARRLFTIFAKYSAPAAADVHRYMISDVPDPLVLAIYLNAESYSTD